VSLAGNRTLFVSGDVGRPSHPLLSPPAAFPGADTALVGSTYGNRTHEPTDVALADAARAVKLLGRYIPVRAEVATVDAFSVHADANELIAWLAPGPAPETTFVVHGESSASTARRDRLEGELDWTATVPTQGERVRLD